MAALVLLVPSGQAVAADDPAPVPWPEVSKAETGSNVDPAPIEWPGVTRDDTASGTDPGPVDWPGPQQN
ncbi:hypothetical protein AB0F43_19820 [Kribbella sp. NPDC023972]|uniref:hypothetical protein n=1 Tax=Kribbella sp. NPDC023972 TaxID=3154795 RepID=UPI0033E24A67